MSSPSPLRALLRATAHLLAARLAKKGISDGHDTEVIVCPPWEITVQAAAIAARPARGSIRIPPAVQRLLNPAIWKDRDLSPLHQALIEAAVAKPQSAKTLARLAGYPYNSRLRQALADLVRSTLIARTADGYRSA